MNFYHYSVDEIIKKFNTNKKTGLTNQDAQERLSHYGFNELPKEKEEPIFSIFLRQFKDPLIYALLIAGLIMFFISKLTDAILILVVLFFNALIGTFQESKTKNLLKSLRSMLIAEVLAIRDGTAQILEEKFLVPGDIIILQEGKKVPADCRILESYDVKVDEAILTGESTPVLKQDTPLQENDLKIYEQKNMLFQGTYVLSGRATCLVVQTGQNTQIGNISKDLESIESKFPLKDEMSNLSKLVIGFVLVTCIIILIAGFLTGKPFSELFSTLAALFVSAVPEGLPVVLTLTLVLGAHAMGKNKALVKRLQAVEGLARINVLMVDKTGTITRNEQVISKFYCNGNFYTVSGQGYYFDGSVFKDDKKILNVTEDTSLYLLGVCCVLLGKAKIEYDQQLKLFKIKGEPIDAAMQVLAKKLGMNFDKIHTEYQQFFIIPFIVEERYQAAFFKHDNKIIAFSIGSLEKIKEQCASTNGAPENNFDYFFDEGFRVIALAYKYFDFLPENNDAFFYKEQLKNMKMLAILGLEDSIREGVVEKIEEAQRAGIKIIMVTGDHNKTAFHVAKEVGLVSQKDKVIEGFEFEKMSDAEKVTASQNYLIYARATPQNKLDLTKTFQAQQLFVGMTGDGVNDAPALAVADIGIAMGNIGTDVAKAAADIILLDDSILSIIDAIKQSRHTFYTLKRIITYYFSTNLAEMCVIILAVIFRLPLPLTAAQILWINLVTDGLLDFGLIFEPLDKKAVIENWQLLKGKIIDKSLLIRIIIMALPQIIGSLFIFLYYYQEDLKLARVMTFLTVAMFQWFNALNSRSFYRSFFKQNPFSNKVLLSAIGTVISLQLLALYTPFFQNFLQVKPISLAQWMLIIAVSSSIMCVIEIKKYIMKKNPKYLNSLKISAIRKMKS